ncbi:hypothetical protein ABT404_33320 [Streptomyces hyaluromycini]|uniref:Uncharacterized protein n=1 Tax=Streptomyces hyaluromycini TaxID=1377993 RepID=A0ABV1X5J2_9ACTN
MSGPAEYRRFLTQIAAAPRAVACRDVCEQLGVPIAAKNVEGVRSKLKRLVERGWLIQTQPVRFTPVQDRAGGGNTEG